MTLYNSIDYIREKGTKLSYNRQVSRRLDIYLFHNNCFRNLS